MSDHHYFTAESPPTPLNTTSLLKLSSKYLHYTPKETLRVAKSLFDKGFITFPTTAVNSWTPTEFEVIRNTAVCVCGEEYVNGTMPMCENVVDDGASHHSHTPIVCGSIRPVFNDNSTMMITHKNETYLQPLQPEEEKLFDIIVKNTLATVLVPTSKKITETIIATTASTPPLPSDIDDSTDDKNASDLQQLRTCEFKSIKKEVINPGYLVAFLPFMSKRSSVGISHHPKEALLTGQRAYLFNSTNKWEHFNPVQIIRRFEGLERFTPTSLVSQLTDEGSIDEESIAGTLKTIDALVKRKYIEIKPDSVLTSVKNKTYFREGEILSTSTGRFLANFLQKHFGFVVDPLFSSSLQKHFKEISQGISDKDKIMNLIMYGSNESAYSESRSSAWRAKGFFRLVSEAVANKLSRFEPGDALPLEPLDTVVLGRHPITSDAVVIRSGKYGNCLQIGGMANDSARKSHVKWYPLPSWLVNEVSITTVDEALQFVDLPRTLWHHPSTNQPIILSISKGLLWIQLGTGKEGYASKVPLEPGLLPSHLTKTMALSKFSVLTEADTL